MQAKKVAASKAEARKKAEQEKQKLQLQNRYIAKSIMKARKNNGSAFPSNEIESLTEIAYKVVAQNFNRYPELEGVEDKKVLKEIVKLTQKNLPITTVARNIDFEFYWQEKCEKDEEMKKENIKREQHGNSYKQAYIETHIQTLLENFKSEGSLEKVKAELEAARYEVFRLVITQLQRFDITHVFHYLPNLAHLTLTYGAKHIGMDYERPLFGMKMSDA